jgi:hypothetical protein
MGLQLSELGGGAKAWSPENIGDKISGKIRLIERRQARSLDTKQLETWDDGSPKMLTSPAPGSRFSGSMSWR